MLCDIRMPGTSGVDLVPQAIEIEPELAILMLTAVNDATSAALCMQRGAMDYLTKPIELADLGRAVQRALKRREMLLENRQLNQWLKEEVSTRTAELQRERMKLERLSIATLEALVNALEAKDPYMRGHSVRVADLSATVAHELGIPEEDVEHVRVAGRLHDIGKIGTRESVLNKQGTLTPEEFEHVKQHVIIGSQILAPLAHLGDIIPAVRHHHERWDGTGYPDGLRGEEIPIGARIIGAAEVFDALSTSRTDSPSAGAGPPPGVNPRKPRGRADPRRSRRRGRAHYPHAGRERRRTPGRHHRRNGSCDLSRRTRGRHQASGRGGASGGCRAIRAHERGRRAGRAGSDPVSSYEVARRRAGPRIGAVARRLPTVDHQWPGERANPHARAGASLVSRRTGVRRRPFPHAARLGRGRRARVRVCGRTACARRRVRAGRAAGPDL